MTAQQYDPITMEIIQNSLQATADEMFGAMRRTAMSAIIYEVLDMGTGIKHKRQDPRRDIFPRTPCAFGLTPGRFSPLLQHSNTPLLQWDRGPRNSL